MIHIDKKLISELFDRALVNPRLRHSFDLCNPDNSGQRMLNVPTRRCEQVMNCLLYTSDAADD